jgi:hypothetical protein
MLAYYSDVRTIDCEVAVCDGGAHVRAHRFTHPPALFTYVLTSLLTRRPTHQARARHTYLCLLWKRLQFRRNTKLYSSLSPMANTMSGNSSITVLAARFIRFNAAASFGFSN